MLAIRLPTKVEKRLQALAKSTGRTKTFYAREAIVEHLDDLEDLYLVKKRLAGRHPLHCQAYERGRDTGDTNARDLNVTPERRPGAAAPGSRRVDRGTRERIRSPRTSAWPARRPEARRSAAARVGARRLWTSRVGDLQVSSLES